MDDDGEVDSDDVQEPALPDEEVDEDLVMDCCEVPFAV